MIKFEELFKWCLENGFDQVVLSDTTFSGVVKFLQTATIYKVKGIVGLRVGIDTYIAKDTNDLKKMFSVYNDYGKTPELVEFLKHNFESISQPPIYYLPGQEDYFKALVEYFGKAPEGVSLVTDFKGFELKVRGEFRYDLKSTQTLHYEKSKDVLLELLENEKEYYDRLKHEIELVKKFGFEGYFYTIKRIVDLARENNIEVGPGRGSAVGSLLAYRLGITKVNPMEFGLLFERFLNEGRRDYPDIDLDVEDIQRQRLISILREEFANVYNISAFATMPEKVLNEYGPLSDYLSDIPVQRTTHAAGVIISTTPMNLPLAPGTETVEWDMKDLEKLGYVKFDILGLKTLTILKYIKEEAKRLWNFSVGSKNGELDDLYEMIPEFEKTGEGKKTYKYISVGFTDNIFQLDSFIGKQVVRDLKPSKFEELVLAISLNRPGPIKAGVTREIRQLKLKKELKFKVPQLSDTYGFPIYQEQVMKIAMDLAGLTSVQADELRKAIAKKDVSKVREIYETLTNKLVEIYGSEGKELARVILSLGEYAFNKSHAVAYAHITYLMAYFKINYPKLFYDVYLKYDTTILPTAVYNLQALGFTIRPPKVNIGSLPAQSNRKAEEKTYVMPLYVVPGISPEKAEILQNQTFNSFEEFVEKSGFSLSTIEALIKIGTFDEIFGSRRKAIQKLRSLKSGINPEVVKIGSKLFGKVIQKEEIKVEDDWERTQMEYDILKIALTPPTKIENLLAPFSLAYALQLPFGIHVAVRAGFGTDGKSVFKAHIPDGEYTLIYPNTYELGKLKIDYVLDEEPLKSEISKTTAGNGYERIVLPNGEIIQNARPLKNSFRTLFVRS
ncbi:DNA polymerase III, alpha subunit [Fervidobacterium pennivorans DSM 9078]|uniref:DNA-directed DNA polymerase n=1 Tax=Fervidobacterium pennivorans (strain DSM 9078 / Ven5) TaxID=771875 RepID=H9UCF6_FERPD|nr:DNA polymerase III subunit alpha [Fervidobacterium pennivorans]AFG35199.1 DNA polymerase III, alpha subunit [Fervidobacterium pennivorans DSM 9078]